MEAQLMAKIEVFSAGCLACQDTTGMVKRVVGTTASSVVVLDMHQADVAARARQLGITRLPSVVIDGSLASCCTDRGPDEATLRAAMGG
jgi:glutaredoxin 3